MSAVSTYLPPAPSGILCPSSPPAHLGRTDRQGAHPVQISAWLVCFCLSMYISVYLYRRGNGDSRVKTQYNSMKT